MYSYMIFRERHGMGFRSLAHPGGQVSPWPYQYDAAFMVRHDLENYTNLVANIGLPPGLEFTNGCKKATTTSAPGPSARMLWIKSTIIAGLRSAMTNYGATIGPHNGGLKNPNNPAFAVTMITGIGARTKSWTSLRRRIPAAKNMPSSRCRTPSWTSRAGFQG